MLQKQSQQIAVSRGCTGALPAMMCILPDVFDIKAAPQSIKTQEKQAARGWPDLEKRKRLQHSAISVVNLTGHSLLNVGQGNA